MNNSERICSKCGQRMIGTANMCPGCGEKVDIKESAKIIKFARPIKYEIPSFVLGIISLGLSWVFVGIATSIVSLILGIVSLAKKCRLKWMAIVGIIFSLVGIAIFLSMVSTISDTAREEKEKVANCNHRWIEANCKEARHCPLCGTKDGDALGHNVTEWIIVKEATINSEGTRGGKCERCGMVTEKESYSLTPDEYEKEYKKACEKVTYKEIARNPDNYKGKYVMVKGEVIQVQKEGNEYVLRVDITRDKWGLYDDTVYVTYTAETGDDSILEDDIIKIYGMCKGEYSYISVLGSQITLPRIDAEIIEIMKED